MAKLWQRLQDPSSLKYLPSSTYLRNKFADSQVRHYYSLWTRAHHLSPTQRGLCWHAEKTTWLQYGSSPSHPAAPYQPFFQPRHTIGSSPKASRSVVASENAKCLLRTVGRPLKQNVWVKHGKGRQLSRLHWEWNRGWPQVPSWRMWAHKSAGCL